MALDATTVWEVRTTGSDTQGGGYSTGGTDYSQQDAAQLSLTDVVADGTTTLTSTTGGFTAAMIGNLIALEGGTGTLVRTRRKVVTVPTASSITVDAAVAAGTGITGKVGGALANPGESLRNVVAGNKIHVRGGTYTITTATANVSNGRLDFNVTGTQTAWIRMIGYTTTRGDGGRFTLAVNTGLAATAVTMNNANSFNALENVNITGNATSGAGALYLQGRSNRVFNLRVSAFTGGGQHIVQITNNATLNDFQITGGATGNYASLFLNGTCSVSDGYVHGNAGRGVDLAGLSPMNLDRVVSAHHTGAGGYGFFCQSTMEYVLRRCVAWNNAKTNYFLQNVNVSLVAIDCVSGQSSEYDFDNRSAPDAIVLIRPRIKTSTSGKYPVTPNVVVGEVVLTGDPFTDATNGNFAPDNVAGEGAALRGVSATYPWGTTFADIGAVQHQDAGGAAGGLLIHPGMQGGVNG